MNPMEPLINWAYPALVEQVTEKAARYGLTKEGLSSAEYLTEMEQKQREVLWAKVQQDGFEQTMKEMARVWFGQFIVLRIMEASGLLPVRVFSDRNGMFCPEILDRFEELDWKGLDISVLLELKETRQHEELFRRLILAQCHELHGKLPGVFPEAGHCSELLLPDNLLRTDSVPARFVTDVPASCWQLPVMKFPDTGGIARSAVARSAFGEYMALWTAARSENGQPKKSIRKTGPGS